MIQDFDERQSNKTGKVLLPLVLPHVPDMKRVVYSIYEYDPLLDSSNMTMDDWIQVCCTTNLGRSHKTFLA